MVRTGFAGNADVGEAFRFPFPLSQIVGRIRRGMSDIDRILDFMIEVEKLKSILRKSRPVGTERYENSAEHSWHVCISALMLKDFANDDMDINHVIKMLLIHDLGEIDAKDTIVYQSNTPELKEKEAACIQRIIGLLPESQQDEYISLWYEFEAGETPESRYARAIDRVPPLLQNLCDNGHGWKKNGISKEQVFTLNARIGLGSVALWKTIESRLEAGVEKGILK
jgi:putative hydrolase of HD superfamily